MNNTQEQSAGNSTIKPSFQSQSLGPNKVASATPPVTTPDTKPDETPEVKPETAHQVTSKPLLEKQS